MNTGDIVTDSRAEVWTLGTMLGEGVWGRSWVVDAGDGRRRVLKVPFEAKDLAAAAADKVELMRACAREQADLLAEDNASSKGFMVTLEDRITLPSGAIALLLPHYPTTLARQLRSGVPLAEALQVLLGVTQALQGANAAHGNLRPTNIMIDPSGRPLLADRATPSAETLMVGAERNSPSRRRWAPEDRIARDTWAICQALHCAASIDEAGSEDGSLPAAPAKLDKVALAEVRDRVERRLRREGANSRFITRTAERVGTLLGRGLSKEADPSPPFRFLKASDLSPRLQEVTALVDPGIESVGKLLLDSSAQGQVFHGPGPVGFTVSVAPTDGVQDADDVVCGVRLTDLDSGERVPIEDAQFTVDRHASGRLRYAFNLPDVTPGRYEARVAFSIKESGHTPTVAEGSFEVRPPAGYVPPVKEAAPTPLAFPGGGLDEDLGSLASLAPFHPPGFEEEDEDDEDEATVLMTRSQLAALDDDTDPGAGERESSPGGELIDAFPRPLAPSGIGTLVEEDEEKPPTPMLAPPTPKVAPPPAQAPPPLAVVPTPPPSEVTSPSEPDSVVPASAPLPTPAPMGVGSEGPGWHATQEGEQDFFAGDPALPDAALPGAGGEDLGGSPAASGVDAIRARAVELASGDSRILVGATILGCLLLVLVTVGLLKAC